MQTARFLSAFGILFFLSVYFFLNIKALDGGSGLLFMAMAILLFGSALLFSGDLPRLLFLKKSSIALFVFLLYFVGKYGFEATSYDFKQVTIGTTGGLIFSFMIGFIASYAVSTVYDMKMNTSTAKITSMFGLAYLLITLVMALIVLQTHLGEVRGDILLVDSADYQRPGDFMIMQFAVLSAMVFVLTSSGNTQSLLSSAPMTLLLIGIGACYMYISQVIGSNKGLVVNAGILLSYLICRYVAKDRRSAPREIGLFSILFTSLGIRLFVGALFSAFILSGVAFVLVKQLQIDVDALRITGFGSGEVTSVTGRLELLQNFKIHFQYSPIMGHTQVDKLTTGEGSYVHSLISILTHLGLVGFVMFLVLMLSLYSDITHPARGGPSTVHTNRQYGLFRLMLIFIIICMGTASAFFIWMPVWFGIAFVGDWFHQQGTVRRGKRESGRRTRRHTRSSPARHHAA